MITIKYYKDTWHGSFSGVDSDLQLLLDRAVDIIDGQLCLSSYTVATVPAFWQTLVYKAVCAQIDYINASGGVNSLADDCAITAESLGQYSYSKSTENLTASGLATDICRMAMIYLSQTGLLYRGL